MSIFINVVFTVCCISCIPKSECVALDAYVVLLSLVLLFYPHLSEMCVCVISLERFGCLYTVPTYVSQSVLLRRILIFVKYCTTEKCQEWNFILLHEYNYVNGLKHVLYICFYFSYHATPLSCLCKCFGCCHNVTENNH